MPRNIQGHRYNRIVGFSVFDNKRRRCGTSGGNDIELPEWLEFGRYLSLERSIQPNSCVNSMTKSLFELRVNQKFSQRVSCYLKAERMRKLLVLHCNRLLSPNSCATAMKNPLFAMRAAIPLRGVSCLKRTVRNSRKYSTLLASKEQCRRAIIN